MTVRINRDRREIPVHAKTASIGATPAIAYVVAPFNGKIVRTYVVSEGASTGTIPVAVKINGGSDIGALSHTGGTGNMGSDVPTASPANRRVAEGDVISFTPSGGGGASIPGNFTAVILRD